MNEVFELEVRASRLDVDRAIKGYIPLLEQCYRLAREEAVVFPPGYERVAEITANASLMAMAAGADIAPSVQATAEAMAAAAVNPEKFGFLVREQATGALLVVIRGTMVIEEWLKNFTAIPNPYDFVRGFGLVHLGFEAVYGSVRNSIVNALQNQPPATRITFVGHSLGGAMVTLAAPDVMINMQRRLVDVFTVGGPRLGKGDFRENFDDRVEDCFRVTNQFDIVPHLPTIATFWRHVGEEIEVDGQAEGHGAHSLASYLAGLTKLQGGASGPSAAALGAALPTAVVVP
jgi:triacylglycerol lipase